MMLEAGAKPSNDVGFGFPLHTAIQNGHFDVVNISIIT